MKPGQTVKARFAIPGNDIGQKRKWRKAYLLGPKQDIPASVMKYANGKTGYDESGFPYMDWKAGAIADETSCIRWNKKKDKRAYPIVLCNDNKVQWVLPEDIKEVK